MAKETTIDLIMQDPKIVELAIKVMEMEPDYDEDWLIPFEPDEKDEETGASIVKSRKGDYGQQISYVPAKYVRQRLDAAFNKKWTFFIIAEHRETEPFQRWSKNDDDYVDGSNYLKCIGMMIIPGFGIRMEYGVKKVFGDAESSDWKACKTDAFKKCAEAFGIYLNYADDDADEDEDSGGRGGKRGSKVDLSDVEYTDDDLDEAFETVLTFGKYKDYSLKEIWEEEDDISYIEWLAENARDDDMRFFASVILKYNEEQEEEKSNRRANRGKGKSKSNSGRSSGRNGGKSSSSTSSRGGRKGKGKKDDDYMNPPEDEEEEEDEKPRRGGNKGSSRTSGRKGKSSDDENEDEKEELMEACRNALDDYDKVQARSMLTSVSVSNRYPKGKTKLEQFTLSELRELAEVLEVE